MNETAIFSQIRMKNFFQRIAAKARDATQPPVLIAALGDSVTQGVTEHVLLDAEGVYHRRLQQRLESFFPTTTFGSINAGVSGGSAAQALDRLEQHVLRHEPDLVLVAFGLNDSLGGLPSLPAFQEALRTIAQRVVQETSAPLIFLTPPFMARRRNPRIHPDHEDFADRIIQAQVSGALARYAEGVREVARETGSALADVHAEWHRLAETGMDTDLWLCNGLNHPDGRGHQLAADLLFHVILCSRP